MSNPGNQNSQKSASKSKPNLIPDALQGTDDTQSEFSVNATREERREDERKADEKSAHAAPTQESDAAETQSEFSVNERLRGNSQS
ncbi:hypothetical protein Q8A64_00840 [Oxalobacteraceae bacterium R-40]|uniref:Uncharacterized protein n=1 Tax=Keguizhuia sedimenti TaxID=3064264 RepID=A0ABU1BKI6_9BURK|nr:hypothetical protein [Oxalobacteraceae bacterium R-40]